MSKSSKIILNILKTQVYFTSKDTNKIPKKKKLKKESYRYIFQKEKEENGWGEIIKEIIQNRRFLNSNIRFQKIIKQYRQNPKEILLQPEIPYPDTLSIKYEDGLIKGIPRHEKTQNIHFPCTLS